MAKAMMKYWGLSLLLTTLLVNGVPATQKQVKRHHVALIVAGLRDSVPPQVQGLRDGLEELGYFHGKNIIIELVRGEDYKELANRLKKLSQQKIDAIITTSGAETALVKKFIKTVPIIFMPAGDPVRSGFVDSLANPGKNLTGLSFFGDSEGLGKQLQVFKQVVPPMHNLMVLYDQRKEGMTSAATLDAIESIATQLPTRLIKEPISSVADAEQTLRRTSINTMTGIFPLCSPVFRAFKKIAVIALQKRLPLFGCNASQVSEEGALLTYSPDMHYIGYRAAQYLDRVLKGAKPQNLPVETPKKFELVINLKTADAIGLTIPPEILILADKVVQ